MPGLRESKIEESGGTNARRWWQVWGVQGRGRRKLCTEWNEGREHTYTKGQSKKEKPRDSCLNSTSDWFKIVLNDGRRQSHSKVICLATMIYFKTSLFYKA